MDKPAATFAWCAVVAIGLSGVLVAAEQEPAALASITLVVTNLAGVSPAILDRAEVEAGRAYRRLGVRTNWIDAAHASAAPTTSSGFTIALVIQSRLAGVSVGGSRSVMAAAPRSWSERGGSIYVFYDHVTDVANVHRADTALLMGIVIAHEMGHLLLHHSEHAGEGLMRGVWDADAIKQGAVGLLWFSPSESHQIRKTLSTCCPP